MLIHWQRKLANLQENPHSHIDNMQTSLRKDGAETHTEKPPAVRWQSWPLTLCIAHITEGYWVRPDLPKGRGFLQFEGLSGGLPRWRAAYDEDWNRTLSQSEKQNKKFTEWLSSVWEKDSMSSGEGVNQETLQSFILCRTQYFSVWAACVTSKTMYRGKKLPFLPPDILWDTLKIMYLLRS